MCVRSTGKGTTQEQLEALDASAEDEFWRLWKVIEPLYFSTFDADLAERVMGRTVISVEAADAGDAIIEGWDLTPRLGEISTPTLILVGRDDFVCPPSQAKIMHEATRTRSWPSSRTAATSRTSRNRRPSSMRSEDGYGAPEERYSPECGEGEFCELRRDRVLGSSA